MIFHQGVYLLDHDPDRTRGFYAGASDTLCDCDGCRNFRAAVSRMPEALRTFLEQLGIDPARPAEMSVLNAITREELCYQGFYHLCGRLLEGTEPFLRTGERSFALDRRYILDLAGDSVWFRSDCHLLDPDFPRPAVQVEVMFSLPWVLEEENTYPGVEA